jgi:hypothetical protein
MSQGFWEQISPFVSAGQASEDDRKGFGGREEANILSRRGRRRRMHKRILIIFLDIDPRTTRSTVFFKCNPPP